MKIQVGKEYTLKSGHKIKILEKSIQNIHTLEFIIK